jgi:thiol-disulfide isomerase/thioredoxin
MMRLRKLGLITGLTACLTLGQACQIPKILSKPGQPVTAGAHGAMLVVFLKDECPSNDRAIPALKALQAALGKRVKVVAVVDASPEKVAAMKLPVASYADPKAEYIRQVGARAALDVFAVPKGMRAVPVKVAYGYSRETVGSALRTAGLTQSEVASALRKARMSDKPIFGCGFGEKP